jgi:hypothetical protein
VTSLALDLHAEIGAAVLHGVTARVLAEHEGIPRRTHVLGAHDLVGAAILQHAVLVDATSWANALRPTTLSPAHLTGELRQHLAIG